MTSKSRRVLVVDDEPEITFALQVYFLSRGYEMLTALDGTEAIGLIRNHPLDLIILDMKMPGVNGIEVLRFVRAHAPATKVLVMTAYDAQFQERVEQIGVEGFLTKPFGIHALTEAVEEVLAGRRIIQPARGRAPESDLRKLPMPRAKLLFVEPAEYTYKLKEVYFQDPDKCRAHYEVAAAYSTEEMLQLLESFRPDILLVDVSLLGARGDLTAQMMKSSFRPREMIIHGSKSILAVDRQENLQQFSALGVRMVPNESFTRSGLLRLGEVIRHTALSCGLVEKP